jgi:hypothetical protein
MPFQFNRKSLRVFILALFVLLLMLAAWRPAPDQAGLSPQPADARLHQATSEPIGTATALSTQPASESGGSPTAFLLFGGILLLAMVFMLIAGIGAAILLVKLRNKFG